MLCVTMSTVLLCGRLQPQQFQVEPLARQGVELAKRFVHQQQAWAVDQSARQDHALVHAARKLARVGVLKALQPHRRQQVMRAAAVGLRHAPLLNLQRQQHVFEHGAPGHEIGLLKDKPDLRVRPRQRLAVEPEGTAVGPHQPTDNAQQRALAGAGRAEQADKFTRGQLEADRLQDGQRAAAVAKGLGRLLYDQQRRCVFHQLWRAFTRQIDW
jgi:hypothetical protein